jgi:hypothetical protein
MPRASAQRTDSTTDTNVSVGVSAVNLADTEAIVAKAVEAATRVLSAEFKKTLIEFESRLAEIEGGN